MSVRAVVEILDGGDAVISHAGIIREADPGYNPA